MEPWASEEEGHQSACCMTILSSASVLYDYPYRIAGSVAAYASLLAPPQYACQLLALNVVVLLYLPRWALPILTMYHMYHMYHLYLPSCICCILLYLPSCALPCLHLHQAEARCFIASDTEYIIPVRVRQPVCV